jgi:outer membrane protein TolC
MKFPPASLLLLLPLLLLPVTRAWGAPLSLSDCLTRAAENNPELRSLAWEPRLARQNLRQVSSALYPRLDGQVGYTIQKDPQAAIIMGRVAELQDSDYSHGGVEAFYTIYDFGKREARISQARAVADASSSRYDAQRTDVSLQVIEAYFGILESMQLVEAARDEITQVEQHRRMAQALFDEGVVTRNDILQADVRLAAARQNLLSRDNRLENIWLRLNYLTGSDPAFRGELSADGEMSHAAETKPDDNDALARRPEILALRKGVEASQAQLRESRSAYFPELFTRLALEYVDNSKYREQTIMSAGVGLKVNLFDGFATTAARQKAVQSLSRSRDLLAQGETQVRLEIATARNDLRVAGERIRVAEAAILQSRENLRMNHERYKERVGTATEVLDAQTLLTQTRTDYFRALFDCKVAAARLRRALGEL